MPIPRFVARANRYLLNPLLRRIAGWLPPFMVIEHRGRASGRPYRTPVIGFFEPGSLGPHPAGAALLFVASMAQQA